MHSNIQLVIENLNKVYQEWSQLDETKKKQKINQILPFIHLASYLDGVIAVAGVQAPEQEQLQNILNGFAQNYQEIFQTDIRTMQSSDLPLDLMQIIASGSSITEEQKIQISQHHLKYEHAHSRVMWNYGEMLKKIAETETSLAAEAQETLEQEDVAAALLKFNEIADIEKNSDKFPKDDLENHALLNQSSNYKRHLALADLLLRDETVPQISELFQRKPEKYIATNVATQKSAHSDAITKLEKFKISLAKKSIVIGQELKMQVGFESESLLSPLQTIFTQPKTQNDQIKIALADLNARRKMQIKYLGKSDIPEISDVTKFLIDEELPKDSARRLDIFEIKKDLEKFLGDRANKDEILKQVDYFTEAEAYFYKLLLLDDRKFLIEIDGVFDPKKTKIENLQTIIPLIKTSRFHENILDMIRAHEVSIGPFDIDQALPALQETLQQQKLVANQTGLSLDNANVQLNLSFWVGDTNVFMPEIEGTGQDTKMYLSRMGAEITQLIAQATADAAETAGVLRGQPSIDINFDRIKQLKNGRLKDTPFTEVDETLSGFTNHKALAAKTGTIRLSIINNEKGIAVAEIRIIGNNPHFGTFLEFEETLQPGIEYIPEVLLPMITQKINEFLEGKTADQIRKLMSEKVEINHKGKIAGLEEGVKVGVISTVNAYNPESSTKYVADETLRDRGTREDPASTFAPSSAKTPFELTRTQSLNFQ